MPSIIKGVRLGSSSSGIGFGGKPRVAWAEWKHRLRLAIPPVMFVVAAVVLFRQLRDIGAGAVLHELMGLSAQTLALAVLTTALSYFSLTLYDTAGLRYIGTPRGYRLTATVSFIAFTFSNNLGMAGMGGAPLRYRYFRSLGIPGADVLRIVAFGYVTFWLGFLALGGVLLSVLPLEVPPDFSLLAGSTRPLGLALLLGLAGYLAWGLRQGRTLRIGGWTLPSPGAPIAAVQILLGAADWLLVGAALYVLLPGTVASSFPWFLAVFLFAQTAALVSTVPGGLGVLETVIILFLAGDGHGPEVVGALLAYRVIYYLVPLFLAILLLAVFHFVQRRNPREPSGEPKRAGVVA
jgi:uncharacterized membrane protein YbhN (UPF0104 family)